jgi:hypothetical protein
MPTHELASQGGKPVVHPTHCPGLAQLKSCSLGLLGQMSKGKGRVHGTGTSSVGQLHGSRCGKDACSGSQGPVGAHTPMCELSTPAPPPPHNTMLPGIKEYRGWLLLCTAPTSQATVPGSALCCFACCYRPRCAMVIHGSSMHPAVPVWPQAALPTGTGIYAVKEVAVETDRWPEVGGKPVLVPSPLYILESMSESENILSVVQWWGRSHAIISTWICCGVSGSLGSVCICASRTQHRFWRSRRSAASLNLH